VLVYRFVHAVVIIASIVLGVKEGIIIGSGAIASVAITIVLMLVVGVAIVVGIAIIGIIVCRLPTV
jgi:hypothetical protein